MRNPCICIHTYTHPQLCSMHRYAEERIQQLDRANRLTPRSRFVDWKPVTAAEMEGFFGVIINMGMIQLPTLESYWSSSWTGKIPFFGRAFPRNRFEQIFWMLHVSRDSPQDPGKKISKVKDVLDMLLANFQQSFTPDRNLSVDETMVGFRGRFASKQYMPSKPTKYGIKAFTLADSTQGYIMNCLVYTGGDTLDEADPSHSMLPQPARIVLHLLEPYLGKGHTVYTDRYYSSLPLALELQQCNTSFVGTMMKNRIDLPDAIRSPSFRLGNDEIMAFRCDRVLAVGWRAAQKKKPLIIIGTESSAKPTPVRAVATGRTAIKPHIVDEYNKSMNGVDKADQYTVYYSFIRRSRKWWRKLFFWLFEVTLVNSYKTMVSNPSTHLHFRQSVVDSLVSRHLATAPPRPRPGRPRKRRHSTEANVERFNVHLGHFPRRGEQRECVVCSDAKHGARKRTSFFCKGCPSNPSLCPDGCFEAYHTP